MVDIKKGSTVQHINGTVGIVSGVWFNEFAGQTIYNVKVNGMAASWNAGNVVSHV